MCNYGRGFISANPNEQNGILVEIAKLDVIVVDGEAGLLVGRPWLPIALKIPEHKVVKYHITLESPPSIPPEFCSNIREGHL